MSSVDAASSARRTAARSARTDSDESAPHRRIVRRTPSGTGGDASDDLGDGSAIPKEILVVASRLKAYVQARSGMSTSDRVLPLLSDHLRKIVDEAIRNAQRDERKTVLDRDVPHP